MTIKSTLVMTFTIALMSGANASAQSVHGVVLEDSVRVPIGGAIVQLIRADGSVAATATTTTAGAFVLHGRGIGKFRVTASHMSYMQMHSDTMRLHEGEAIRVELRMARAAIAIEPLVVTAVSTARLGGFYERRERGGFGKYLTREDIRTRGGARVTDLLFGMPGINIVPVARGMGSGATVNLITARGTATRGCMPAIFIDGIHVQQYPESGIDDFLTQGMLEAVEVYPSMAGVPPQFDRGMNNCGAVAFWTRVGVEGGKMSVAGVALVGGVMLLLSLVAGAVSN